MPSPNEFRRRFRDSGTPLVSARKRFRYDLKWAAVHSTNDTSGYGL